jgi:outer membrane receptor for ferric coprogen and ferric-rhodotorulic acid
MNATCLLALAIGTALIVATPAMAQATSAETATRDFDIRAGALGSALLRFAEQSGLQFSVTSEMTAGKRTAGIKGKYTPEDGLRALLSGTGLTFRFTGPRTVVIEPAPETGDARVLGPLRIEGAAGRAGVSGNGVNGSTDGTATENSGTYAASATSFVSKVVQSTLDTPASVSVVSRQQMTEQNINTFADAMRQMPGITTRPAENNQSFEFLSRGFYITKMRIDGGAPMYFGAGPDGNYLMSTFDMALYDHIEVLRGADGMFSGFGNPGGVVNLVRKRPLDHFQVLTELEVGSWNNKRTVLDVTGPLGFDGRVRGRAVMTYQDTDYFYKTAWDKHTTVYGVLEADVFDGLTLRGGFSLTSQTGLPWQSGMPRYETGERLNLSRDTCLCYADSKFELRNSELFLQADYSINDDWVVNVNINRIRQKNDKTVLEPSGAVNPLTGKGYGWEWTQWHRTDRNPVRNAFDASVTGTFEFLGRRHSVSAGINRQEGYSHSWDSFGYTYGGAAYRGQIPGIEAGDPYYLGVDVENFNPRDFRYLPYNLRLQGYADEGRNENTAYLNLNSHLTEKLQLNIGLRYSHYETNNKGRSYCAPFIGGLCNVYEQDADGNWIVVGTIPAGTAYPMGAETVRDKDSEFSWPPTWSLVYGINDSWSLYGSYADTYVSNGSYVTPNHEVLPPETGFNAEFGSNYLSTDGMLSGKASLYYVKKTGFVTLLYDDQAFNESMRGSKACCYAGGDNTLSVSYGLDTEVTGQLAEGWQASASYTYNSNYTENKLQGWRSDPVSISPRHLFKLWTTYRFVNGGDAWSRLSIGGGVNMQTETFSNGSICVEYVAVEGPNGQQSYSCSRTSWFEFSQGFYAIYSARAAYRFNDAWELSLNIDNMFDKEYYTRTAAPGNDNWYGEPRSYALVLRGKF